MEELEITHKYTILYDQETDQSEVYYGDVDFDESNPDFQITQPSENTNEMLTFHNPNIDFGTIFKGEKVTLTYEFVGDGNLIEKVKPSCGCTAEVNVDKVNNKITAVFDSTNESVNPGGKGIKKGIIVYYKDGEPIKLDNKLGKKQILKSPKPYFHLEEKLSHLYRVNLISFSPKAIKGLVLGPF